MSRRLRACLAATLAATLASATAKAEGAGDYAPGSREWNGLATLGDLAHEAGCELQPADALDWSMLQGTDVLWFVYPRAQVEPQKLRRFLQAGGRVVVADDFGAAGGALESLGIRRAHPPGDELERYNKNPNLPIAHARLQTALGRSSLSLVANHPAAFATAMPATFELSPGAALVVEGRVGRGQLVAIADPSVLINNMLEIESNRAFARALVETTCKQGRDRILLYTQVFRSQGEPPEVLAELTPDAGAGPFSDFNTMLGRFDTRAQQLTAQPALLWAAGMLALCVLLAVLANTFPARVEIRDRWTRVGRLLRPTVDDAPLQGLPWDFGTPAAILREEVLERLTARLSEPLDFDWLGPQALRKKVEATLGPEPARRAAEVWRLLHRMHWRTVDGESLPDERVSRRTLLTLHQAATRLFASLET